VFRGKTLRDFGINSALLLVKSGHAAFAAPANA
jgi:hypothetical protein